MSERALDGATVILTRRAEDDAELARSLSEAGAVVIQHPCIRTVPLESTGELRAAVTSLGPLDLMVLTSRAGADAVATVLGRETLGCAVAAVGRSTARRAADLGMEVVFVPGRADAVTLARELPLPAGCVLLARSDLAAGEPVAILHRRGARVREVTAYTTIAEADGDVARLMAALRDARVTIVLASPSAVDALAVAVGTALLQRATFVALGPRTAERIRKRCGVVPRVAAGAATDAVFNAIRDSAHEEAIT